MVLVRGWKGGMTSSLGSLRRVVVPNLVALALVAVACTGGGTSSPSRSSTTGDQGTPASVRELASIDTLRDVFNGDAGSTRLILLISPT
jgi:hypothetical protein